jgi:hypothetical protein
MNKLSFLQSTIAIFLLFTLALSSCVDMDDSDSDDSSNSSHIEAQMDNGKTLLAEAQYKQASEVFADILTDLDSGYNPAKFGWSISISLLMLHGAVGDVVELITAIGSFANSFLRIPAGSERDAAIARLTAQQGTGILAGIIATLVEPFNAYLLSIDQYLDEVVADPSFEFRTDSIPVVVDGKYVMNIGGEYDTSEAMAFSAIIKMLLALIDFVYATNFEINLNRMLDPFEEMLGDDVVANMSTFISLAAFLFDASPNFLQLTGNGPALMQSAGNRLGDAAGLIALSIDTAFDETDDQSDDIFAVDHAAVPPMAALNIDVANDIAGSSASSNIMLITITADLKMSMERLRDNLLSGGAPISWAEDIAPLMSVLSLLLFDTGLSGVLTDSFLGQIEADLASLLVEAGDVIGISEQGISDALVTLVPDYMQFDFGTFFGNPQAMRRIFPPMLVSDNAYDSTSAVFDSTILLEWECDKDALYSDDSVIPGFLCPVDDSGLIDAGHFPGETSLAPENSSYDADFYSELGVSGIARDGIKNPLPYIPFGDPTICNLLWLNVSEIEGNGEGAEGEGFQPATLYTLNKVLASVGNRVIGLIAGLE